MKKKIYQKERIKIEIEIPVPKSTNNKYYFDKIELPNKEELIRKLKEKIES